MTDSAPNRLRTIVVDDDPFARRSIKDSLQSAGIVVIAEATTGREAVELAVHYQPDVVVMDAVMPELDGLEATRLITERVPGVRIVIVTASESDDLGILALRLGAVGVVSKGLGPDVLPRALEAVCRGEAVVSRQLTLRLIEYLRSSPKGRAGMRPVRSVLTAREWEVLDLLCEGSTTTSIGEQLVLSRETVRTHVKNIVRKLGVHSRGEAVLAAQRLRDEPAATA